ncbi:MAG: tetratricopeptide repeat protein [Betaproteobacteria bacterium]|nr:tetratricopeptide repeat protein [Betaproteobacteria bacterium]
MLTRLIQLLTGGGAGKKTQRAAPLPVEASGDAGRADAACREADALIEHGRLDEAESRLREAIALRHDFAEAHGRLGAIHEQRGELEDAADCYQLAIHFDPALAVAHFGLARLHKGQGRHAEAAAHYRRIIEHHPDDAAAHRNLCLALHETGEYAQALAHGRRALAIDPGLTEARHNLGLVLLAVGDPEQAMQHFRRALEERPCAETASALGHAYRDLGRLEDAIAAYDHARSFSPDFGDAVLNRAHALLLNGDYSAGWAEYEKRFIATGSGVRDFGLPRWNGEPLQGRTILVHAEQGLGDEIMFASCVPDVIANAGHVVIECNDRLEALFRRSFPGATVHGGKKDDPADWLERHAPVHCQTPIGGLPRHFRSELAAFPQARGYLRADPARVRAWRERLGAADGRLRIGLSWRGGTPKTRTHLRSMAPEELGPLSRPGFDFVNLQYGAAARSLTGNAPVMHTFPGVGEDLDEMAALICALDLVVSVANTTVHLAGALGRPVWALLSPSPEWRYGARGETMPWYPSARLFRRGHGKGWDAVIGRIARELDELRYTQHLK